MATVSEDKNALGGAHELGGSSALATKAVHEGSVEAGFANEDEAAIERIEKVYRYVLYLRPTHPPSPGSPRIYN